MTEEAAKDQAVKVEKFSSAELTSLRNDLMQAGLDSWQAADVVSGFLAGHGYGVSTQAVRDTVTRMEHSGCSLECMQTALESLAFVQ
ncbi:MAG: hypothetical protein ACR2JE_01005 [Acidobacteriaceae bacterium]